MEDAKSSVLQAVQPVPGSHPRVLMEPLPALPPARERRELRDRMGVTMVEVAAWCGVTRETVRTWEAGRTPNPRNHRRYAKLLAEWQESIAAMQ